MPNRQSSSPHGPAGNTGPRQRIAQEAARIMAASGQRQYLGAKQKAAQRLGADPRQALPSNAEVAAALKDYLELFGGVERQQALRQLFATALQAMYSLAAWHPRLSGTLAEDLGDRHSIIQIDLFSDDPDAPLHELAERGLPYRQKQKRIRWYQEQYRVVDTLNFQAGEYPVELWLFDLDDRRRAPPSPIDGRPRARLDLKAVTAKLAAYEERLAAL